MRIPGRQCPVRHSGHGVWQDQDTALMEDRHNGQIDSLSREATEKIAKRMMRVSNLVRGKRR